MKSATGSITISRVGRAGSAGVGFPRSVITTVPRVSLERSNTGWRRFGKSRVVPRRGRRRGPRGGASGYLFNFFKKKIARNS